jgi:eukaryotic-like serine/threonine-protein kinase
VKTVVTADFVRLFDSCAQLPPDARHTWLQTECREHPEVGQLIERVLDNSAPIEHDTLLRDGGLMKWTEQLLAEDQEQPDQIGRYRVLSTLSRGGMGTVLLAVRSDLQNTGLVALKVINRGLDRGAFLTIFDREREILASLKSHPNIVHLEDADVTRTGAPYLVMEYVDGLPLNEYCEKNGLTVEDRLKLFLKVCEAVSFAHQRAIIHRDLKPNNVLVTASGTPKLLDFGIGKLLATSEREASVSIVEQNRIMTIEYASPEQVRGELLDVRTDVYSLGVVLYRMLTGVLPYDLNPESSALREKAVCEQEPRLASVAAQDKEGYAKDLPRLLSGDLDTILNKALRKRADERYASVEQFNEDIVHHLRHEPIRARPNTWTYSTGRFIRRHRLPVLTAASFILLLSISFVLVSWQAHVARLQRTRAENRFNDVRQLAQWLLFDFHDQISRLPGSTEPRKQLVQHAQLYLDHLASEEGNDASLQSDLASSYTRLGDVQGNPRDNNQGDVPGALASYQKGLKIFDQLHSAGVNDPVAERARATLEGRMADIDISMGKTDQALALLLQSAKELQAVVSNANTPDNQYSLGVAQMRIGDTYGQLGKLQPAMDQFNHAMQIFDALHREHPDDLRFTRGVTVQYGKFGDVYLLEGNLKAALENFQKGLQIREKLLAAHPDDRQFARDVSISADSISTVLTNMKKFPEALEYENRVLKITQQLSEADKKDMTAKSDVGDAYAGIAQLLFELHRYPKALQNANHSLEARQAVAQVMTADFTAQASIADTFLLQSMIQERTRRTAGALRSAQSGLEVAERLHKQDPGNAQYYELLGKGYYRSAKAMEGASAPNSKSRSLVLYQKAQTCYEDLKKDQRLTDDGATLLSETTGALTRLQKNRLSTHAE